MNTLRLLLYVVCGWLLGTATTLAWVWVSEGKADRGPHGSSVVLMLVIMSSVLSAALLGSTIIQLAGYMLDGEGQ